MNLIGEIVASFFWWADGRVLKRKTHTGHHHDKMAERALAAIDARWASAEKP